MLALPFDFAICIDYFKPLAKAFYWGNFASDYLLPLATNVGLWFNKSLILSWICLAVILRMFD